MTSQRGFSTVEALVACALIGAVALWGLSSVAWAIAQARSAPSRAAVSSLVEAELIEARIGAAYTQGGAATFRGATATVTPEPLPSGVPGNPTIPSSIDVVVTVEQADAASHLAIVAAVPALGAISGSVDLTQALPAADATGTIAAPTAIPRPITTPSP